MRPTLPSDEVTEVSIFSADAGWRAAALEHARGDAEIATAAIAVITGEIEHDADGRAALLPLATWCVEVGKLRYAVVEKIAAIDVFTTNEEFDGLLAQVRDALQLVPVDQLRSRAEQLIVEETAGLTQYSANDDQNKRPVRTREEVARDRAKRLARRQLGSSRGWRRKSQ